jgi:hypothetical protein
MPRTSQFVPKGTATPNTPNHHPLVDQPNTPAMEASAQAMASSSLPADQTPAAPTPIMERTRREMEVGRDAIERHASVHDDFKRASAEADPAANAEPPQAFDTLDDGTPVIKDVAGDTTPVTLEDGTQGRVPRQVADAARSADRARSADVGTGKLARGVDPRNPAVREEEAHPDVDRNTPRGPATLGRDTSDR